MSESTHVSIVAVLYLARVGLTEFELVFLWMVELLYSVMRRGACVTNWTVFISMVLRTRFTRIGA
jgi:hypothetical protein